MLETDCSAQNNITEFIKIKRFKLEKISIGIFN